MEYELTLTTLAYGGTAMGRLPDGRAVFVPFGLPNERVRVRSTEEKRGFARAEIIEILEVSPARIIPRCKHFFSPPTSGEGSGVRASACGGCHYQNLSYENQLKAKAGILRDQLQRIGKLENPPVKPMVASPDEWHYRNHVQFHLMEDGKLGFVNAQGNSVIPISECHLPEKEINDFWPELNFEKGLNLERVSLRKGYEDELMLILAANESETPEFEIETDISVVHLFEEHPVVIAGTEYVALHILDQDFHVSAASFFQVNTKLAEKMVQHLLAHLPVSISTTLLDVYCGVGLFSKFCAPRYKQVIGIESSASACEDFAFNLDEFNNVDLYEGAAEEVLPGLIGQIASPVHMIVDPPRAGLEKHALDAIVAIRPQIIVYVSCDPATLARDATRLIAAGYQLEDVTPFDLFPQTYHIESISIFKA